MPMKMALATAVHHSAACHLYSNGVTYSHHEGLGPNASDVTQAPVNVYTTFALVNACTTTAMSLTWWSIFSWTFKVRYPVAMVHSDNIVAAMVLPRGHLA